MKIAIFEIKSLRFGQLGIRVTELALYSPEKWAEILPLVDAGYRLHRHKARSGVQWEAIRQGPKRGKWKRPVPIRVAERMKRLGMLTQVAK